MSLLPCPYCAEPIQPLATKCRFCKEMLPNDWSSQPAAKSESTTVVQPEAVSDSASAIAPVELPPGGPVTLRTRLDTPAPRREKSGLYSFVAVAVLWGGYPLFLGLTRGDSLGLVMGCATLTLVVLPFVRRPLAFWLLIGLLGALSVFEVALYGRLAATPAVTEESRQAAARVVWLALALGAWLAYFWRRRWWFSVLMPLPVPESSPKGGILMLTFVLIGTAALLYFASYIIFAVLLG